MIFHSKYPVSKIRPSDYLRIEDLVTDRISSTGYSQKTNVLTTVEDKNKQLRPLG